MKRPGLLVFFVILTIIVLSVVRITFINSISTTGIELNNIQNEISSYKKQNALLQEKYLELAAFTNIEKKAKVLGFTQINSSINLSAPIPLAFSANPN